MSSRCKVLTCGVTNVWQLQEWEGAGLGNPSSKQLGAADPYDVNPQPVSSFLALYQGEQGGWHSMWQVE